MGITCPGVRAITRMTNQNVQTMFALLEENKYPQKILMWLAISNRGMSIPYFRPSKSVAINTEIYVAINTETSAYNYDSYHLSTNITGDFNYLFWPDLAREHYSKESVAWMNENVYFVDETTIPIKLDQ